MPNTLKMVSTTLCNTPYKESKGDIEYLTGVHISVRETSDVLMNDLDLVI